MLLAFIATLIMLSREKYWCDWGLQQYGSIFKVGNIGDISEAGDIRGMGDNSNIEVVGSALVIRSLTTLIIQMTLAGNIEEGDDIGDIVHSCNIATLVPCWKPWCFVPSVTLGILENFVT